MSAVPQLYQLKARLLGISPMGIAHRLGRAFNRVAGTVGRAYRQAGARRTRRVCRRHPGQDADRREDRQGPYRAALELRPLREAMVRTGARPVRGISSAWIGRGSSPPPIFRAKRAPCMPTDSPASTACSAKASPRNKPAWSMSAASSWRLRARWIDHREGRHRANCQALCHR